MSKLLVFVSSTMEDLENERDAVCQRLREFNCEPVNAEGWQPDGTNSWERISNAISQSHVFVLISGQRYGWVPPSETQNGTALSVTHLEYEFARSRNIPVLPFFKKLAYKTGSSTPDEVARDRFRDEISRWQTGYFITNFHIGRDLADKVGSAIVEVLTQEYLRTAISTHAAHAPGVHVLPHSSIRAQTSQAEINIPPSLMAAVRARSAVLFAGSGMSLSAGMPSASVFVEHLRQTLYGDVSSYEVSPAGPAFSAIAADLEAARSRDHLTNEVRRLLNPPQGVIPTAAHYSAVELFDHIVTTNWDSLFEDAAAARPRSFHTIVDEISAPLPPHAIIKFHGSLAEPDSLVLTETDIALLDKTRARLWAQTRELLHHHPIVVVGSSLRDPSIVRLFEESRSTAQGYFVAPGLDDISARRLQKWNLEPIVTNADGFFEALSAAL